MIASAGDGARRARENEPAARPHEPLERRPQRLERRYRSRSPRRRALVSSGERRALRDVDVRRDGEARDHRPAALLERRDDELPFPSGIADDDDDRKRDRVRRVRRRALRRRTSP